MLKSIFNLFKRNGRISKKEFIRRLKILYKEFQTAGELAWPYNNEPIFIKTNDEFVDMLSTCNRLTKDEIRKIINEMEEF